MAADHFCHTFSSNNEHTYGLENISHFSGTKLTEAQRVTLVEPVTRKEIKDVFWNMNLNKAPGPDGFNGHSFRETWCIVGREV